MCDLQSWLDQLGVSSHERDVLCWSGLAGPAKLGLVGLWSIVLLEYLQYVIEQG